MKSKLVGLDMVVSALSEASEVTLSVSGGCMNPILFDGDKVSICRVRFYIPGDIVVYRTLDCELNFVHRYLGCVFSGKMLKHIVKADDSDLPDTMVLGTALIGRVTRVNDITHSPSLAFRLSSAYHFLRYVIILIKRRILRFNQFNNHPE